MLIGHRPTFESRSAAWARRTLREAASRHGKGWAVDLYYLGISLAMVAAFLVPAALAAYAGARLPVAESLGLGFLLVVAGGFLMVGGGTWIEVFFLGAAVLLAGIALPSSAIASAKRSTDDPRIGRIA